MFHSWKHCQETKDLENYGWSIMPKQITKEQTIRMNFGNTINQLQN
ncbi:MAG: hypothetical protein ABIO55_02680 [Ginsengibacter sp.]